LDVQEENPAEEHKARLTPGIFYADLSMIGSIYP
jgi:hypothetical protein